ncbi:hypothetical protein FN846DRAFT_887576 [Sphaerosporella brunnea]|uniref:Uncharacterized protein n=1 Tax=Sphaerosporella brunnea TaxID=1250544 RepID=A0A5J5F6L8_9PEZI|nr:hypothetical protein FN846DRAFT_887576 [Sphaerosporella brunnea]
MEDIARRHRKKRRKVSRRAGAFSTSQSVAPTSASMVDEGMVRATHTSASEQPQVSGAAKIPSWKTAKRPDEEPETLQGEFSKLLHKYQTTNMSDVSRIPTREIPEQTMVNYTVDEWGVKRRKIVVPKAL